MDVNPRKIPRQSRAQATVRAIIEATAQVLVHAGFERMTTAMVAERAGVSVGSLYQYYPNKQALAAAVVDHYGEVFAARFAQAIAAGPGDTLARTVDALVATAFESHPHDPRLHKVLIEIAPRVGRGDHRKALSARIAALIEEKLRRHAGDLAADLDPSEAAVMLEALLETAAHRALEQHPPACRPRGLRVNAGGWSWPTSHARRGAPEEAFMVAAHSGATPCRSAPPAAAMRICRRRAAGPDQPAASATPNACRKPILPAGVISSALVPARRRTQP